MPNEYAYVISHDVARFEHYEDDYYSDLRAVNVPENERLDIFDSEPLKVPNPVIYSGNLPVIRTLDFPFTDNSWLVMSRKMLSALESVGGLKHREYPVVIADNRYLPADWRDADGNLRSEKIMTGYVAIQILERLDIFDFEKSSYEPDPDFKFLIGNVSEYVFKIPPGGLPPVFHIKGEPVKTFISHQARMAVKKAGVTGVEYISLKGYNRGKGMFVDVPVPNPNE